MGILYRTATISVLILLLLFVGVTPSTSDSKGKPVKETLLEAEKAMEAGDFNQAIKVVTPLLSDTLDDSSAATANLIMGIALYRNTYQEIHENRKDGKVVMGDLSPEQVQILKDSVQYLERVLEHNPDDYTKSIIYLTIGKLKDWECLQHFGDARDAYQKAYQISPHSEIGSEAKRCINNLDSYSVHGSSHGETKEK